jgi:preprotein translocase subunit SecF
VRLLRLIPDDTSFPFMKFRPFAFGLSALISVATIIGFLMIGLNIGIDFKGGTLVELQTKQGNAEYRRAAHPAAGRQTSATSSCRSSAAPTSSWSATASSRAANPASRRRCAASAP